MTKIFISHATADNKMVTKLMDMLQTQFNLTRDNFFYTSDEELTFGGNWIEEIRKGMIDATLILPIITPRYLESQFCLCELGAAWVNQQALVPIIIPPLDHNALSATPYRTWVQALTLTTTTDLQRLGDAFTKRQIGTAAQMVRFTSRAQDFYNETLTPFIEEMKKRETITPAIVKTLRDQNAALNEAFKMTEDEVRALQSENEKLRSMKDAEQVKAMDHSQMSEWDTFLQAVETAKKTLSNFNRLATSVLYHNYKGSPYGGFVGADEDRYQLNVLENEGLIVFDEGWQPDFKHPLVDQAQQALSKLDNVIRTYGDIIQDRFFKDFGTVRLGLAFSPFWERVLEQRIDHSTR
ncbi:MULTISPECIES: toll/interleukin-1 receptor domain-containing protein [unclassified Paenibacillus]|uniref:toll/interleukin-1 receptor domain-containing protein n=1 Tax=unclassified Paenibacillus TaxID=185978 RepID=UPI0027855ACE|nr:MULTISPECIES: toll/interleukin-1 receptor domain-containing protein [unclassified Paenibacillus]MDQ0896411.1 hypothetical protein [Paenibacillus sp. V4I7]MDQ0914045.1 hypothetical protein [Paenibacillus sp. V4I5]